MPHDGGVADSLNYIHAQPGYITKVQYLIYSQYIFHNQTILACEAQAMSQTTLFSLFSIFSQSYRL